MASPMTAPTSTQIAPWSAEAAWPVRNSAVSIPSRMTATKARMARAVTEPATSRSIHRGVELAFDARRLAAHPEQHPGHDPGRDQQGGGLEQLLVRLLEAARP